MCCVMQIRGMHTIIRDASTSKNDFVFFADRLSRLVVEAGLGHLPFHEKTVITPTGGWDRGVCKAPVWQHRWGGACQFWPTDRVAAFERMSCTCDCLTPLGCSGLSLPFCS